MARIDTVEIEIDGTELSFRARDGVVALEIDGGEPLILADDDQDAIRLFLARNRPKAKAGA